MENNYYEEEMYLSEFIEDKVEEIKKGLEQFKNKEIGQSILLTGKYDNGQIIIH